ncbi:Ground-like domain protein [Aphelenchoides besseyi]|nr:Ground-like domain protein [Aphelenchoides besseyi]
MIALSLLLFGLLVQSAAGFLFGGASGSNCNCCPPPPACSSCPCGVRVYDDKTVSAQPLDELELRAKLNGVQFENQPMHDSLVASPRQLELLERLGDEQPPVVEIPYVQTYNRSGDIRFSPQRLPIENDATVEETIESIEQTTTEPNVEEIKRVDSSTAAPIVEHSSQNDEDEIKCNSQVLKKLMIENMTENSAVSKRQIASEAQRIFGGLFQNLFMHQFSLFIGEIDVICSRGHFSYVYRSVAIYGLTINELFSSALFCEATKEAVTCIAFRQQVS